ncbi:MAG: sugar ABC transporter permease [Acidimicrobiia bacterium]|nr:MAG: sugar ABC transporter permease [Acidimicrobiia bacterium]
MTPDPRTLDSETTAVAKPATKPKATARQRKRHKQNVMLVTPQLIIYLALILIPLVVALPLLFTDMTTIRDTSVNYIGFDNFTRLFTDPGIAGDYWAGFFKTVRFTILNYAGVFIFGLTLALLMYEVGFRGGLFTMIYLPWMISGLALGFMALMLFSESTGSVNLLLKNLGLIDTGFNIKSETGTTIVLPIVISWKAAGFNMAIFLAGLLSIPKDTIEAAIVDGASYRQRLGHVYFPQMVPSFVIATIFALLGSFSVFDELIAMGGLNQNDAAEFLSILFFRWGFTQNKLALAMALSVMTFIPLTIIAIGLQWYQRRATSYQS